MFERTLLAMFLVLLPYLVYATDECDRADDLYKESGKLLRYEDRKEAFARVVELCPSHAKAHNDLADACEHTGDFDAAAKHYQEAIRLKPDFVVPYVGLGEVYLKTAQYWRAGETFLQGLQIDPRDRRLKAGAKVAAERVKEKRKFFAADRITECLVQDKEFQLMCMCPGDRFSFLRKLICVPPIFFPIESDRLTCAGRRQLKEIGSALKSEKLIGKKWTIIGHADSTGTREENLRISERRANAVRNHLVTRCGIAPESVSVAFYGDQRPRHSSEMSEGRSWNRRVEIVLVE